MAEPQISNDTAGAKAPKASPFTMAAPAAVSPLVAAQAPAEDRADPRKYGLLPMAAGSQHRLTIAGKEGLWTAKDRAAYSSAKGFYFCIGCARTEHGYKPFADKKALVDGHPTAEAMRKNKEVHLYGFYSNEAIPKDLGEGAIGLLSGDEPTS